MLRKSEEATEEVTFADSSNIHSALYSPKSNMLIIRFKANKEDDHAKSAYEYTDVAGTIWEELKASKSKGWYVRTFIVGKFKGERVW